MRFALTLPKGALRDAALSTCAFSTASRGEPRAAIALVQSIADPVTKGVVAAGVMNAWTPHDPVAARAWLAELKAELPPLNFAQVSEAFGTKAQQCAPSLVNP